VPLDAPLTRQLIGTPETTELMRDAEHFSEKPIMALQAIGALNMSRPMCCARSRACVWNSIRSERAEEHAALP